MKRALALVLALLLTGCASTGATERAGAILVVGGLLTGAAGTAVAVGTCSPDPSFCRDTDRNAAIGAPLAIAGGVAIVLGLILFTMPPTHHSAPAAPVDPVPPAPSPRSYAPPF